MKAWVLRQNMAVDEGEFWAWVLKVAHTGGPPWPVKPGVAGCDYEIVSASDKEWERLRAGDYLDADGSLCSSQT